MCGYYNIFRTLEYIVYNLSIWISCNYLKSLRDIVNKYIIIIIINNVSKLYIFYK